MPTAACHPNGTLFVVCGNGHAIARTTTPPGSGVPIWASNWSAQVQLHPEGEQGAWEDPDLWFDRNENFHILCGALVTA